MEKKIMYTENVPEKKFLWLHHKDGDLVLESFSNNGWESIGKEMSINTEEIMANVTKLLKSKKQKAIKINLPKLTENCSKKELLSTIDKLTNALVKTGIIEI